MILLVKAKHVDPSQMDLFGGDTPLQQKKTWVRHPKTGKMFQKTVYVRTDKNRSAPKTARVAQMDEPDPWKVEPWKVEPWELTKEQWTRARESIHKYTQVNATKNDLSQMRAEHAKVQHLVRSEDVGRADKELLRKLKDGEIQMTDDDIYWMYHRMNGSVKHPDVVAWAVLQGKDIPDHVRDEFMADVEHRVKGNYLYSPSEKKALEVLQRTYDPALDPENVKRMAEGASPTNAKEYTDYLSQMLGDVPSRKQALFNAQVEMSGLPKEEQLKALKEMGVDVDSGNVLDQFKSKLESMQRKARAGKESDQKSFVKDQDKKRRDAKLQGMVQQAEETAKQSDSDFDPDNFMKVAADSWGELRRSDVYRLLDEAWPDNTKAMADAIVKNRSDLKGEVENVLKILSPDKGAASEARQELGGKLEAERVDSFMESAMKQAYDQHVNNLGTWMEKQKAAPTAKRQVVKQIREKFPEFAAKVDGAIKNRFRVTSGNGQSFLHFTKKDGTDKIVSDWPRSNYPKYQIYLDAVNELTNEIRHGR